MAANVAVCMYLGARSGFDVFLCSRRYIFLLSFHNGSSGLVSRAANMGAEQKFPFRAKCVNVCVHMGRNAQVNYCKFYKMFMDGGEWHACVSVCVCALWYCTV